MSDDLEKTQSVNLWLLLYSSLPQRIMLGRRYPTVACPITRGPQPQALTESAFHHSKWHFHKSIGNSKWGKTCIYDGQASPSPTDHVLKYSYYFSANCTRYPAHLPPDWDSLLPLQDSYNLWTLQPNPLKIRMKPCKQKQQIMHCRENLWNRQWVSWHSDDEAQQRYNRLQKQSWIAYYLGRGRRSGWASYIGTDSAVCSFPVQHSEIDTVLTRPPGVRPRRRPGRWDKCDWSASHGAQRQSAPYIRRLLG